jgi:hypothetical protein
LVQRLLQPRRLAVALAAIVGLLVALYVIVLATAGVRAGYSWHDMDWDGDGRTDLREVGLRPCRFEVSALEFGSCVEREVSPLNSSDR